MRKDAKKISKTLRELRMKAQNRRASTKAQRKGSKVTRELVKGFEKRRLDIRRFLKRKSRNNSKGIY